MNWVGGARSRLKVPNERKLQKEYFERKRLGGKARDQALDPPISKDLLFLSKAAENDYTDKSPRAVPNRVSLESAVKHPGRNLELPMSPIDKPSTLDLADTSLVSSLNHSFYPPHLSTNTLPKVSTMKLPQGWPPVNNSMKASRNKREDVLNVSCVSESLFPATRRLGQEKTGNQSSISGRMAKKQYSIDELLDSSQIREKHILKQQLGKEKEVSSKKHSNDILWTNLGGMVGRKRPASVNPDNQYKQAAKKPAILKPKKDAGYDFSGWVSKLDKVSGNASKVEQIYDKDTMLEIHYAPDDEPTKTEPPKPQRVSRKEDNKKTLPLISALLTENPFSNHHKESQHTTVHTEKPKAAVKQKLKSQNDTILNESILGPLKKARAEPPALNKNKERRSNAFEKMMVSFEKKETKLPYPKNALSDVPSEKNKPQKDRSSCWKKFVSGEVEEPYKEPFKKPELPVLKVKKSMNCSAWEELLCLEQEAFGLDTCTQELTLSPLDCTEEPLLRQVPDVTTKKTQAFYRFDSSQDSLISLKSSSGKSTQSQPWASNDCSLQTNLDKEVKLSEVIYEENLITVFPSVSIENTEATVPVFNNTVEAASCTKAMDITTSDEKYDNNSAPISPVKSFTSLCTQTSPGIVCPPASNNQEQQTSPTVECKTPPSSIDVQSHTPSQESTHTGKECKNIATQVGCISSELTALKQEVSRLQKELGSAESTIIWQSLMLKIKDI